MTDLKAVDFGMNQYCGPSVLSVLTGENTDRCAAVISAVSGKQTIKAVEKGHLREALKRLRFTVEDTVFRGSTLYSTLHMMHKREGKYVVFVPEHVIAIEVTSKDIYICDNHTKTPIDVKQSARLAQRVIDVWKVVAKEPPILLRSEITVTNLYNKIQIGRNNIYKNPEDNNREELGSFRYKDMRELRQIISLLESYK